MHFTGLVIDGLKGTKKSFKLKPLTLVIGDNFSGKSTIVDALRVVGIDYDPSLGKRNMDTFQLAAGKSMRIEAYTDTEEQVAVEFTREPDGNVKKSREGELRLPPVLVDLDVYWSMTEAERIEHVFRALKVPGLKPKAVSEGVSALEVLPTKIAKPYMAKLAGLGAGKSQGNPAAWLGILAEAIQKELKAKTSEHKSAAGALAGFSGSGGASIPPDRSAPLKAKREALEAEIAGYGNGDSEWRRAQERLEAINGEAEYLVEVWPGMAGEPVIDLKTYVSETDGLRARVVTATQKLGDAATELKCRENDLAEITENATSVLKHDACPTCRTEGNDWKKPFLKYIQGKQEEVRKLIEEQCKVVEVARATVKNLTKAVALAERRDAIVEYQTLMAEVATLNKVPKPVERDDAREKKLRGEIATLETEQQAFNVWKHNSDNRERLSAATIDLAVHVECCKKALEFLRGVQQEAIENCMKPMLDRANLLTTGILRAPLVYRDGTFGMDLDGHFVTHKTFCKTESLLAYAGISLALAMDSPIKLLILDDMGRLSKHHKVEVFERCMGMVQDGTIDQAVLIDVQDDYPQLKGKAKAVCERIEV